MIRQSSGLLVYRRVGDAVEILLVHPGGPYWANKDDGAWSVPKGEIEGDEDLLLAAKREFAEEIGTQPPEGTYAELGSSRQSSKKEVFVWAVEGNVNADSIVSNRLQIEWPPKSGKTLDIPEVDRAAWVLLARAPTKLNVGQRVFVDRLAAMLNIELQELPQQQALF